MTTGGAAVGATAVVPGIGTGVTLALSGVETLGFLEATALFAQSVAEVHGIPIDNPDRARALVLALMLGQEGVALVSQLAGQATGKGAVPRQVLGRTGHQDDPARRGGPARRSAQDELHAPASPCAGGASWIGKALPFGIGAAVGGAGNNILGRRVLVSSRRAFGIAPADLPLELEPRAGAARLEYSAGRGIRRAGGAVVGGLTRGAQAVGSVGRRGSKKDRADAAASIDPSLDPDDLGDD